MRSMVKVLPMLKLFMLNSVFWVGEIPMLKMQDPGTELLGSFCKVRKIGQVSFFFSILFSTFWASVVVC